MSLCRPLSCCHRAAAIQSSPWCRRVVTSPSPGGRGGGGGVPRGWGRARAWWVTSAAGAGDGGAQQPRQPGHAQRHAPHDGRTQQPVCGDRGHIRRGDRGHGDTGHRDTRTTCQMGGHGTRGHVTAQPAPAPPCPLLLRGDAPGTPWAGQGVLGAPSTSQYVPVAVPVRPSGGSSGGPSVSQGSHIPAHPRMSQCGCQHIPVCLSGSPSVFQWGS